MVKFDDDELTDMTRNEIEDMLGYTHTHTYTYTYTYTYTHTHRRTQPGTPAWAGVRVRGGEGGA